MRFIKLLLILAAISLFIFACTQPDTTTTENTNKAETVTPEATPTPDELASGRKHWKEHCVRCHKDDGTGGEVEIDGKTLEADDLTSEKMKKMPDEKYIKYITNGIPSEGMPAFKDKLTVEQMNELVEFIRKDIQK